MIRRSLIAATAIVMAFATQARAEGLENMTDAEREAFRSEVREYLLESPEVILEAIQVLEERRAVAAADTDAQLVVANAGALLDDGFSFVGGNPEGNITLIEFMDYRCGFCKRAHPIVRQLLEEDPQIRFVEKQFPILGPDSVDATRVAMAALDLDPSMYLELTNQLMEYPGSMTEDVALRIADAIGYDVVALKQGIDAPEITARIEENYALASAIGIQGTPGFVIGTEVIRGFVPLEDLEAVVAKARAAATN